MNKKLFFLVVMLGMALQGMAQEPFTIKKPRFQKYVKLNNGVNLRQSPSANSPRLVLRFEEDNGCGNPAPDLLWLNRPLRKNEEAARATVLPVWEQSFLPTIKVADGWLCGHYEGKLVYVMEKFCKPVPLRPLSEKEDVKSVAGLNDLVVVKTGKYKDYCIAIFEDNNIGEQHLRIGKYVDGMFIFKYMLFYSLNSETKESSLDKREKEELSDVFYFCTKIADNDLSDIDLQKLVRDQVSMDILMKKATTINNYWPITYYGVKGDKNWYIISGIG